MRYLSFRIWITQDEYFQLCLSENFIISFFNTGIIAHCINTQHFFLFISCWTSRLLFFPGYYEQRMDGCMDEQVICVVGSFGYKPKGGIAGWCGGSIFPIFFFFLQNLHADVHSGCVRLYSQQQCFYFLHPGQYWLSLCFILLISGYSGCSPLEKYF